MFFAHTHTCKPMHTYIHTQTHTSPVPIPITITIHATLTHKHSHVYMNVHMHMYLHTHNNLHTPMHFHRHVHVHAQCALTKEAVRGGRQETKACNSHTLHTAQQRGSQRHHERIRNQEKQAGEEVMSGFLRVLLCICMYMCGCICMY